MKVYGRGLGGGGSSEGDGSTRSPTPVPAPCYSPSRATVTMPEASAMKKFGWPKGTPLTTESFNKLVADWKAGTLKPTLKSEPVPDAAAAVKTVVVRAARRGAAA